MKLKSIIIAMVMTLIITAAAFAQSAAPGAAKQKRPAQPGAIKALGLTDQQRTQILDIVKKYNADVREVAKSTATKEEKKTKIDALKASATDAVYAVMTPEQREKAKQAGYVDRLLSPKKARNGDIGKLIAKLNLTDDQKTKIKDIMTTARDAGKAIRNDASLNDAQKKAKIIEHRKQTHEQMLNVLTPEQQQQLKDMMKDKKQPRKAA